MSGSIHFSRSPVELTFDIWVKVRGFCGWAFRNRCYRIMHRGSCKDKRPIKSGIIKKPRDCDTLPLNGSKVLLPGTVIRCRLRLMARLFTSGLRLRPVTHGRPKLKHTRAVYRHNVSSLASEMHRSRFLVP